jgi:hypothetical protein
MRHREDETPSWSKDARGLKDRTTPFIDIHEGHERDDDVESTSANALQPRSIDGSIADAEGLALFFFACAGDHPWSRVHARDLRPAAREESTMVSFTASEVEYPEPTN